MHIIFRKYGNVVEITEIEKVPSKTRVRHTREKRTVYGARRYDNLKRTKTICVRRVSAALAEYGCPLLVTLTFKGDASDAAYASNSLRGFQVRLRDKYPECQSLFIPELSPTGRIHFHGLLFNVPLHLGDIKNGRRIISYGTERETRTLARLWGQGFVDAVKTDGSRRLATYISKYITKGAGQVMFNGMRLLRISHGFPECFELSGVFAAQMSQRYARRKPDQVWEGQSAFVGKITKRTFG